MECRESSSRGAWHLQSAQRMGAILPLPLWSHMLVEEGNSNFFANSFQVLRGTVGRGPISPASPASLALTPRTPRPHHLAFGPEHRDAAVVLRDGETQLAVENKCKRALGGEAHYKTMPSRPTSKFLCFTSKRYLILCPQTQLHLHFSKWKGFCLFGHVIFVRLVVIPAL